MVLRSQLIAAGLTPSAIAHRTRRRELHPIHRGVFSVGVTELGRHGRWMAAVLACGRGALLSHHSAAELWELAPRQTGAIEVTLPVASRRRIRGMVIHHRTVLGPRDHRARHRIPVTSPARTLADLALRLSGNELEAAINEADRLDLIDPERLRRALDEMRGEQGASRLLRLLDRQVFRSTDSELERMFLRLVRAAGLPTPQTGVRLSGFWVDLLLAGAQAGRGNGRFAVPPDGGAAGA